MSRFNPVRAPWWGIEMPMSSGGSAYYLAARVVCSQVGMLLLSFWCYLASLDGYSTSWRLRGVKMNLYMKFLALVYLSAIGVSASAQNSYVCVEDLATGFSFDRSQKQWKSVDFKPNSKYLISRSRDSSRIWEIKEMGSSAPTAFCEKDFSDSGQIRCNGIGKEFLFNRKSLRFLATYTVGFWNEDALRSFVPNRNEGDDTPTLIIGRCNVL
jgi:hypothetical protein